MDPDPTSWPFKDARGGKGPLIPVKYDTVEDLIEDQPDLIRNCVLVLNWPFANDSRYDYDAVRLLQPMSIWATIEKNESAGGSLFHSVIYFKGDIPDYCGPHSEEEKIQAQSLSKMYKITEEIEKISPMRDMLMCLCILICARTDREE